MNYLYLLKRCLVAVFSLFIVSSAVFLITHVLPGSAANVVLGTQATEQSIQQVRQSLGLHRPLHVQYVDFVVGVFSGNFGESMISGQPVMAMIWPRFVRTIQLALVAMVISIITAIPIGIFIAAKRDTWLDHVVSNLAYVGVSVPSFVSATILLLVFTTPPLDIFPNGGYVPIWEGITPWFMHLLLPALAMNVIIFAYVLRQTRSSMVETLESDFIRTARLKGVKERSVLFRHALRNGLLPTITVLALNFGWMMGSVVIIEEIFSYPGLGRLIIRAISNRDLPLIQAGILIPTAAFILANLLADVIYTVLDPRISLGES